MSLDFPKYALICAALLAGTVNVALAEDVTYEQILDDPDNIDLNYQYAQQQAVKGDLEQAAAALERILLLQPNYDNARLFYAIVLFRLDDMQGSKRELELLQDRPLSPSQQSEVRKYLAQAVSRSKTTRVFGYVTTGFRVDSNPDLTTESVVDLNGNQLGNNSQTDVAFVANAGVRMEHTIPGGAGNFIFIEAAGDLNEQFQVSEADYVDGGAKLGATLFFGDLEVTANGFADVLSLEGQLYRASYGGNLQFSYAVTPRLDVFVSGGLGYEDYYRVSEDSAGSARDGWLTRASTGFSYLTSETNKVVARVNGYFKDAAFESYSYDALELVLSDTWLLGRGQYIKGIVSYRWLDYRQANPIYSPFMAQQDELFKARLAYGAPVGTLLEFVNLESPEAIADINFQIGVNYLDQDSNIPNYIANSLSADVLLTKRFEY
ncbi:hypothetical protein AAFN47_14955 [Hoeflea sp. CAU 1731]